MKTIGILGGMSAASTQIYYRYLTQLTRARLGGLHSPDLLIRSVDFDPIAKMQAADDWQGAARQLNAAAQQLQRGGAEVLIMATNTMHKVVDQVMQNVSIPLIHIADATAARIVAAGHRAPGLIATAFTMEQTFYLGRLGDHGLAPIIPAKADRDLVHQVIYAELCQDITTDASRASYARIAADLQVMGADCLILGCTEVGMLLGPHNVTLPLFDTTLIHCEAALDFALR